ncbi:acyl-CoA N-acyltransferase [Pholiota conissans]|uniref:Acyl-CoA N-acyltransferase n=1 Tax=Pholiota conissans TaxID=109636 RepID=A0A9P5Z424_9AGAR|nr:acyl-CoA N-acyltransferase [Pholiota conissans]
MTHIIFDYVPASDIPAALEIEATGFIPEEAGSESSFRFRQSQAPQLFLGAYELQSDSRTLIGYVCATQSPDESLTHDSMTSHVPGSSSVCIHSVCVSPTYRGKGVGQALLKEYLSHLEAARTEGTATWERVVLIAHDHLVPFYEKAGFENLGKSHVVHGPLPWFEVRKTLTAPLKSTVKTPQVPGAGQKISPTVLEALQRPRAAPSSKLISDFPDGISGVLQSSSSSDVSTNKYDLLCPRGDCGSVILKQGVGKWVERASVQMEPTGHQNPHLPVLPTPPETTQWWLITPSPMEFENVGFTRPVQPLTDLGRKIKLLTCAECDLGPLGWSEEGGSEFWLACSRVAYRT